MDAGRPNPVPSIPEKFSSVSSGGVVAGLLLAGVVLLVGRIPLWHTDFWGHLRFGQALREAGFFTREPASPFTDPDAPYLHSQWLTQVVYSFAFEAGEALAGGDAARRLHGGVEAIRLLHAGLCGLLFLLVYAACRARGASPGVAAIGLALAVVFGLNALLYHRPQLFGLVGFAAVLVLLGRRLPGWGTVAGLVAVFVPWANLHGSFVVGLFLLGLWAVGRAVEVFTAPDGSFAAVFRDEAFRRLVAAAVLATAAVAVLNPHGPALLYHVATFGRHPNLATLTEWLPIRFQWGGGGHVGWLLLLGVVAVTRAATRTPFTWPERVVLVVFFALPFLQQRMAIWLNLLVPWVLARPWQALRDRQIAEGGLLPTARTRAGFAVVAGLLVAVVAFLPGVRWLWLGHPGVALETAVAAPTPWEIALRWGDRPPRTIFTSETVGDYLFWALPPGSRVLMTTHAHLFPPGHWQACLKVKYAEDGWKAVLDEYEVDAILVDASEHRGLVTAVARDPAWRVVEDGRSRTRLFLAERK